MPPHNTQKTNIFLISIALIAFFSLKLFSPSFVDYLYQNNHYELLNKAAFTTEKQSLAHYQGVVENNVFGPIKSLLSGLLFLYLCLHYLRTASSFKFALSIFLYLLLTRYEILINPPFGESLTGLFYEAVWLLQNNLDYIGLHRAGTYSTGGPQFYPTSIYSFVIAVLMKFFPSKTLFFVFMHLLTFIFASLLLTQFRQLLKRYLDDDTALLTVLLLLFYPLFQSMVELINLEITNLFLVLSSVVFLTQRKFLTAAVMSLLSMLVKAPGFISCIVVFLASLFYIFQQTEKKKSLGPCITGFLTLSLGLCLTLLRDYFMGEQPINNQVNFFAGWFNVVLTPWFWFYILSFFICLGKMSYWWYETEQANKNVRAFLNEFDLVLYMHMMTGLWFLMYLNYNVIIYRYQMLLAPFLLFCLVFALSYFIKRPAIRYGILLILITVCLSSSHGWPYRTPFVFASQTACINKPQPSCLERSLEYRNYLTLEKKIVKEMEENFFSYTIGAPWGAAQAIGVPEMGYTDKKMTVMPYGMTMAHLGLKKFTGLKYLNQKKTVWVGFKHDRILEEIDFPTDPRDTILKTIESGDIKAYIFMGGYAIEKMRIIGLLFKHGLLEKVLKGEVSFQEAYEHL